MPVYKKKAPATYRKKTYKKPVVSQAVKKYVKQVTAKVKPEMKQLYSEANELTYNTLSTAYTFEEFILLQGSTANTRVGNEVFLQGLHLKGVWHNNATNSIYVRTLILGYTDSIQDGAFSELFRTSTGNATDLTTTVGLDIIYKPINKVKWHVYEDKVTKLAPSTSTDGNNTKFFSIFQKFGGSKIKFEAGTTGFTNQNKRFCVLHLAADANDDTTTGSVIELSSILRWYFTDP